MNLIKFNSIKFLLNEMLHKTLAQEYDFVRIDLWHPH